MNTQLFGVRRPVGGLVGCHLSQVARELWRIARRHRVM